MCAALHSIHAQTIWRAIVREALLCPERDVAHRVIREGAHEEWKGLKQGKVLVGR